MRATVFASSEQAEGFLEYSLSGIDIATPILVLSRAATVPAAARHGLNTVLRHAYLAGAAATPVRCVITLVYTGGPRLGSMRAAGYEFVAPRAGWDTEAQARTQPLLAVLPRRRLYRAPAALLDALARRPETMQVDTASIAAALRLQCEAATACVHPS